MGRRQSDINGILVVDKPGRTGAVVDPRALPTSHDVVQRVRRATGQRRIGHTGTLDPMADGVLVLCLGQATRLVEYYQGHDKVYHAGITLGTATDTLDALGQVTDEQPVPALDRAAVETALAQFRGPIDQVPPLFSALKRDGESLHRKARRGESVTLEARPVVIHELTLVDWMPPARLEIRLRCSAGTYVRSLARDLGPALGTVAHLDALRREAAGPFTLADAHALAAIEETAARGEIAAMLLPTGARLGLPVLRLDPATATRIGHGQQVALDAVPNSSMSDDPAWSEGGLAAAHDDGGDFLGVMRCLHRQDEGRWVWKAEKWLA